MNEYEGSICLSLNYHVMEAEGNSHAVILMKNGDQVHSQHTDKGIQDKYNLSKLSVHSLRQCNTLYNNLFPTGTVLRQSNLQQ